MKIIIMDFAFGGPTSMTCWIVRKIELVLFGRRENSQTRYRKLLYLWWVPPPMPSREPPFPVSCRQFRSMITIRAIPLKQNTPTFTLNPTALCKFPPPPHSVIFKEIEWLLNFTNIQDVRYWIIYICWCPFFLINIYYECCSFQWICHQNMIYNINILLALSLLLGQILASRLFRKVSMNCSKQGWRESLCNLSFLRITLPKIVPNLTILALLCKFF